MWDRLSAKIESILKKGSNAPNVELETRTGNAGLPSLKIEYGVVSSDIKVAKGNLRMMEVEQEILSHAIRRLCMHAYERLKAHCVYLCVPWSKVRLFGVDSK